MNSKVLVVEVQSLVHYCPTLIFLPNLFYYYTFNNIYYYLLNRPQIHSFETLIRLADRTGPIEN